MQENLQEYVAKKREIFFVQMSLDTKRAEIRKLEERIFQREEVLLSYQMLNPWHNIWLDQFVVLKATKSWICHQMRSTAW